MNTDKLLIQWCDALLRLQLHGIGQPRLDGGILCPACMRVHGRSGDAVLPLVACWAKTGRDRYLRGALALYDWSENMLRPDGSYNNDTNSDWNGITVFAANQLAETLLHYGDTLPPAIRQRWEARFAGLADYLERNIEYIGGNINYPITCAYTMALAARLLPSPQRFAAKAKALATFARSYITDDGFLFGEGHPRDVRTPKGCRPVDIGYNIEESLPSLALYAELTGDEITMDAVLRAARRHLEFMLPDGGWDNSFGSRSYKWSYWGSRTSDGCLAGFAVLARRDPLFAEAAVRNFVLLERCTHNGLLYGGPMYYEAGEPPCVHHTFCHAKILASLTLPDAPGLSLPFEKADGLVRYPGMDVVRLYKGGWAATISGYDYQYLPGGHPTGGMPTFVWNRAWGPVFAGSMARYTQNEPNNMQWPAQAYDICTTPRLCAAEAASSNDLTAEVRTGDDSTALWAEGQGRLCTTDQQSHGTYRFRTALTPRGLALTGCCDRADAVLYLPIISRADDHVTFLHPECVQIRRGNLLLSLTGNHPLSVDARYNAEGRGFGRMFNPVGGFQTLPLEMDGSDRFHVTVSVEVLS